MYNEYMNNRRINVRGIIYKNGKIFAQQLTPKPDGTPRDFWCTPGGGLDPEEPLIAGLEREIFEETGIKAKVGKLLFIQQFIDAIYGNEDLELFFHIENPEDFANVDLTKTSHGVEEIKNFKFINPKKYDLKPNFLKNIHFDDYISNEKPVVINNELG